MQIKWRSTIIIIKVLWDPAGPDLAHKQLLFLPKVEYYVS